MAMTKTIRLASDQAEWLADAAKESGLSENMVIGALISHAMQDGWRPVVRVDRGGWINGPSAPVE